MTGSRQVCMYIYNRRRGAPLLMHTASRAPTTLPLMLGWPCNKSFGGLLLQLVLRYTLPAEKLCAASLSHASSPRKCTCCCRWTSSGMPQRSWWALCAKSGRRALTCSTSTSEEAWALTTTTGEQSLMSTMAMLADLAGMAKTGCFSVQSLSGAAHACRKLLCLACA